jgi:hypothetical protein
MEWKMIPDRIEVVPEHQKVVETLGWQPGIWGAFFIVVACLFLIPGKGPPIAIEWAIAGSAAVLGLVLASYEIWRRRNRTVLVKDGEHIAVFRKGRLDLTIAPSEITVVKAGLTIMMKIGTGLGACAAAFTAIGILGLVRDKEAVVDNLIILSLGLTCGASLAFATWTQFCRAHLQVPVKEGWMAEETVLVPPSRLKELFP